MSASTTGLTVRKTIVVDCSVERAFGVFTDGISRWWPLQSHSVGPERAREVVLEGRAGGRVFEVWDDGQERPWADVLVWEPPSRLVLAWQPNPGRAAPTEVEIRFERAGESTRVELEHRAWERLGDEAAEAHASYDTGWDAVLARYAGEATH
jgi:uncharacterized protein YndB with AHSA1/START domain